MAFDGITVAALKTELNREIGGGRIYKIAQPETDELILTIKTPTGQKRLYISASASLPLMYLTEENKPSPMTAPGFCMLLRKYIGNGRITSITQPGLERIICLSIEHLNELGDLCVKHLYIEIMGKHSNIIFCDDKGMILDSIKHVSTQMSSVREVLPGRTYFIPDTMNKKDPFSVSDEDFIEILRSKPCGIAKALYISFTGISPVMAESVCALAGLDSSIPAASFEKDYLYHLSHQFKNEIDKVLQCDFSPIIYERDGVPVEYSAIRLHQYDTFEEKCFTSISFLLSTYYDTKNKITRIRQKSADLRHVVQTALERANKKYDLQYKQLKDTQGREKYRIYGELLQAYGYGLEPKATSLTCTNFYDGKKITIPLDIQLNAQENAQKYFARYNKQKRTHEALSGLLKETGDDIIYLESLVNALDIALTEADLAQIKDELEQAGYIKKRFTKKKQKTINKPLHYISSDGYHMYVGKNNLQNDELTFKFATGGDWWFHAKGVPGSHVIVKTEGHELPDRTFEEAARLAAYYSKSRDTDKVEIDYIEKKHVKKPNGAKPGFVVYYTNYSMVIDPNIKEILQL